MTTKKATTTKPAAKKSPRKPAKKAVKKPPFRLVQEVTVVRTLPGVSPASIWSAVAKARRAHGDVAGARQAMANVRALRASAQVSRARPRRSSAA